MKIYLLTFSDITKGTRLKFVPKLTRIFIDTIPDHDKFIGEINNKKTTIIFGLHIEKLSQKDIELVKYYSNSLNNVHTIYNNISNIDIIYDKYICSERLSKTCKYLQIPEYKLINNEKDLNSIEFPYLLMSNKSSGGDNIFYCKDTKDATEYYKILLQNMKKNINNKFENNKYFDKIICKKFIESKYKDYNISIRLYILNDILLDIRPRPSSNSIIHVFSQVKDKKVLQDCHNEIAFWFKNNDKYVKNVLKEIYQLLGDGFYCCDLLLNNDKLYLCEFEYKYYETTTEKFLTNNNLYFKERLESKKFHINFVKQYFRKLAKFKP